MEANFKIEKNISLPPKRKYFHKIPFESMDIGDSFKIEINEKESSKRLIVGRLFAAISYVKKANIIGKEWIFTTRTIDNYIRCWRIK